MTKFIRRRHVLAGGAAVLAAPSIVRAQTKPIRIGVLTDMIGVYAANTGQGSVIGAQMATRNTCGE